LQLCFGIWSDHCRLSWGKRTPFIIFGTAAIIVSLLGLAWTESLVRLLSNLFGGSVHGDTNHSATVAVSVALMFCLSFAIQPVQGGIRALIVDNCPAHQQQEANAWASRISSIANVLTYLSAFLNLPQYLLYFGGTQFKNLSVLASFCLAITLAISCICANEKNRRLEIPIRLDEDSISKKLGDFCREITRISTQVKAIYLIQFFAWIGWCPYLFYVTT
jgi:solute carrier family 45 protein 1/2/4